MDPRRLVGMKVNPDTAQNVRFVITGNTADTLTVYGDLIAAGPLTQQTTFEISQTVPPTPQTIHTVMGSVASAYMATAGVKLYWTIDDTAGPRVPWQLFLSEQAMADWVAGCRDSGRQVAPEQYEDRYVYFTHLGFCDAYHAQPDCGGGTKGASTARLVFTFTAEATAKSLKLTTEQMLTMITAHELGHAVRCDHDEYNQYAFDIAYVGTSAA